MTAAEVIARYHDLWHVEESKSDFLRRPMFHHTRASFEAHLTIVFTALAVAHAIRSWTGPVDRQGRQTTTAAAHCHHRHQLVHPEIPEAQRKILTDLGIKPGY